ncbi:hypothetical protein [Streptomyces wuyuanensis]|uniref:Helix-turn-helix domain-containing protein n=1 Tax=Streptomyces wuyuanensis TaxID=1196353 RepID=A0A1G9VXF9_9ACTN|nr:hypothetical protein [Streptomyces wuyuanensis]SDM76626.1 hypothetical protein SAMN05444921_11324 [Streptomyces wuyuanensis]
MSTDEQATRASGSVPHAYGNALAWRWSREMPTALRRGFLTLLYALRAMANANGELRFPDKPIRIQDIARAAGADEKDARRYVNAGIAAGVIAVKGEQRRGKPTLYVLMVVPDPDWGAAEASLKGSRRTPGRAPAPWRKDSESSGDRDPNQFGGPRPELEAPEPEEVRGTAPRMGSGDRAPNGSGDRAPNNPGTTHEPSHDGAGVVFKPQVVGAAEPQKIDFTQEQDHHAEQPRDFIRCARCHERMVPRGNRTTHAHCTPKPERTAS